LIPGFNFRIHITVAILHLYFIHKSRTPGWLAKDGVSRADTSVLNILSEIDPSASCFNEAQTIAKTADTKVDAEEKKQWDFQMKQYNDAVSIEKQRVEAIKEIAVSYYKSQPTTVNYNYIVK
jgi:hypothetical protein